MKLQQSRPAENHSTGRHQLVGSTSFDGGQPAQEQWLKTKKLRLEALMGWAKTVRSVGSFKLS